MTFEKTQPNSGWVPTPDVAARATRRSTFELAGWALLIVIAVALVLWVVQRLHGLMPGGIVDHRPWLGQYRQVGSFVSWTLGDTTEPGYAHSALAGLLMLCGAALAHRAFRRNKSWMGFPVTSGTGLFTWAVGSAGLGLVLSNLAWGWTIADTGLWQPTFVAVASVPAAVVLIYGARKAVAVTGAILGAGLTTPVALVAVNVVCRPLGLPSVVGATAGMWVSALIVFAACRRLSWMGEPAVAVPRCNTAAPHCFVDTARQGPRWLARRMLADFTEAQFIGNEWASAAIARRSLCERLVVGSSSSEFVSFSWRFAISRHFA